MFQLAVFSGLSARFARLGATVVGVDLSAEGLKRTQELVEKEGGQFHAYECDISVPERVYKLANQVEREVGFISILVNNAGVVTGKMFLNTDEKDITRTFNVNTFANFWVSHFGTCRRFVNQFGDSASRRSTKVDFRLKFLEQSF